MPRLQAKEQRFDFLSGPRGASEELQAGFDAGFVVETLDIDLLSELLPTVMPDQFGEDVFQGESVQGVIGLGHDLMVNIKH